MEYVRAIKKADSSERNATSDSNRLVVTDQPDVP